MNPLEFLNTTNYPSSFLEGTFGDKFYNQTVNPAKLGTGPKPTLGTLAKNWNPLKAFTPQMLATGPTKAASTFLKSSGIGTLAGMFLDPTVANADEVEWAQQMMMDRRATQKGVAQVAMQKQIQQAEAAAAQQAAAAHAARQRSTPGYGSAPGGQGFDAGTGRTTTSGYSGRTGQKEMMADGGLAGLVYLLYGGLV